MAQTYGGAPVLASVCTATSIRYGPGQPVRLVLWMRIALVLAMLGLLLGVARAQTRDLAAEPAYPQPDAPRAAAKAHKAKPKAKPKPAATESAAIKPATAKPIVANPPVPKPAPQSKIEVKAEPKRDSAPSAPSEPFADLPPLERAAIRAALLWSASDDDAAAHGDDPMMAAIKAYQKRNKSKVTGTLSESERADLLAAAKTHESAFGWSVAIDPATGIRLGIPGKLAPQVREAQNGTRWSSRHGEIEIETFRVKTTESLNALFEVQKKEAGRKLESSALRSDGFLLSGLQGLKQFAVRAQMKNGELRGYTMLYDQAMAGIVARVLPAMANAFAPFPAGATPIASLSQPVAYGTGIIVNPAGYIIADRRFGDGCDVIAVSGLGNAERVALDDQHGLALLRVYGRRNLKAAVLAPDGAAPRELTLIGIAAPHTQDGGSQRSEIKAQLADGNAIRLRDPVPLAGFSGAAALDPQGRVIGIMEMRNIQLASAQPAAPRVRLVPAAAIRGFLAAHDVALSQDADGANASIVRVICVRH
jgi:hypothetical protein